MKIRLGFVSNSSSSSFCILGVTINKNDLKIGDKTFGELREDEDNEDFDEWDAIDDFFDKKSIEGRVGFEGDDDSLYIGLSAQNLPEDKTITEIKEYIVAELKAIGINKKVKDIGWMEESTGNF